MQITNEIDEKVVSYCVFQIAFDKQQSHRNPIH